MRIPGGILPAVVMAVCVLALSPAMCALEVPFLAGRVNDNADILSHDTIMEIETLLKMHEDSTSNQVVVLTISGLGGEDIESYAIHVAETWKLGQKGKDNGVLLLVAKDDRKVRIEVGRGLEGNLTDAICGSIIRREIVPQFKAGDYNRGVKAGVEAILAAIQGAYTPEAASGSGGDLVPRLLAFALFLVVVGVFTVIGLLSRGFGSWFLYLFLIPFWAAFPMALLGLVAGGGLFGLYLLGFPALKLLLAKTTRGKDLWKKWGKGFAAGGLSMGRGGWSSGGGGGSSGGSSFSGGGGSFSGGGSSGSW